MKGVVLQAATDEAKSERKRRALVHIGPTKTGSTAIQLSLARAFKEGQLSDIDYPRLVGHGNRERPDHNFFRALYRPREKFTRTYKSVYGTSTGAEDLARDVAAFREGLLEAIERSHQLVFSGEYLATLKPHEIVSFKDELHSLGIEEVTPLIYVRDPVPRYLSSIQQRIKASSTFPPPSGFRDDTMNCIRRWREVFPNLIVRAFDRTKLADGDVVSDFLAVISNHFGVKFSSQIKSISGNESLSAEGMVILQEYRSRFHGDNDDVFLPDSSTLIRLLLRSKEAVAQTRPALAPFAREALARNHAHFAEELWTDYGIDYRVRTCSDSAVDTGVPDGKRLSVRDVLECYDQRVVHELMLWLLRQNLAQIIRLRKK